MARPGKQSPVAGSLAPGLLGGSFLWLLAVTLCTPCGVASQSLYAASEPIVQVNGAAEFEAHLLGTPHAWLVEFYAAWCGHCQRFAPTWRQLAHDIKGWSKAVRVATVACSEASNAALCRQQNVWGYPTIKFFPPAMATMTGGQKFTSRKTLVAVRQDTLHYVETIERTHPSNERPRVGFYSDYRDLQAWYRRPGTSRVYVIIEDSHNPTELGKMAILDFSEVYPTTVIGRMSNANFENTPERLPAVYRVNPDGSSSLLATDSTRYGMVDAIRRDLRRDTVNQAASPTPVTPAPEVTISPGVHSTLVPYEPSDGLHMQDLESSLYYSLWVEVGAHQNIAGPTLQALKAYIHILAQFHPGQHTLINFLEEVDRTLNAVGHDMTGAEWVNMITEMQTTEAHVPNLLRWTGCQGSEPRFRGYPCSLWMTFHALTVQVYRTGNLASGVAALRAIQGYVRHFLGCRECADHFGNMAETMGRDLQDSVNLNRAAVLWLWKAHNRANHRLHGDDTEDPQHPKVQFPTQEVCPQCRLGSPPAGRYSNLTQWDEEAVFRYLLQFFNVANIIQDDLPFTFTAGSTIEPRTASLGFTLGVIASSTPTTLAPNANCTPEATEWSDCSASCDAGYSTRLSNHNPLCRMELELRLCRLRPCHADFSGWRHHSRRQYCAAYGATYRESNPKYLRFNDDCISVLPYRWRYCGLCSGLCCRPTVTETVSLDIQCSSVRGLTQALWISRCTCEPCS